MVSEKEVKKWLNRAYRIDELIKMDKAKIEEWEELSKSLGGLSTSERVQSSTNTNSPFEDKIFSKDEAIKKYEERILERMKVKEEIDQAINSLEDNEIIQVLDYRYLQFYKFREIAKVMYLSLTQTHRLHDKGIIMLGSKLKWNKWNNNMW